jgi:hypothetical protein
MYLRGQHDYKLEDFHYRWPEKPCSSWSVLGGKILSLPPSPGTEINVWPGSWKQLVNIEHFGVVHILRTRRHMFMRWMLLFGHCNCGWRRVVDSEASADIYDLKPCSFCTVHYSCNMPLPRCWVTNEDISSISKLVQWKFGMRTHPTKNVLMAQGMRHYKCCHST